jgi:hypothetical protein
MWAVVIEIALSAWIAARRFIVALDPSCRVVAHEESAIGPPTRLRPSEIGLLRRERCTTRPRSGGG